jgi:hypothetical protein
MNKCTVAGLLFTASCLLVPAGAATIGDIQAFYNSSSNFNQGVQDGTIFVIENTSASAITNGVFSLVGTDSFNVGTIAAHSNFILTPGISNDGGSGHTFFSHTGSVLDESDSGPDGNNTQFSFTGLVGGQTVLSFDASGLLTPGIFTPNFTKGPSNDGTLEVVNFLGGLDDGPCNNCFGPKIVANLALAEVTGVPEPSTLLLFGSALVAIGAARRFKRSR